MSRSQTGLVIVGVGGLAGLLVLAAAAAASSPTVRREGERMLNVVEDWVQTLLAKTSKHEGTYGSVNANKDGQGVSYGIIQWTQAGGGLGQLLTAMYAKAPAEFQRVFGVAWSELLSVTRNASLGTVGGEVLWSPGWVKRFTAAGEVPAFREVQVAMASRGEHMQAAVKIARLLDVATERGMVFCYNRTVHQGVGGAAKKAAALRALWNGKPASRPASVNDRLAQFGWLCADGFRSTTPPSGKLAPNGMVAFNPKGTIWWSPRTTELSELKQGDYRVSKVPVSGVWHGVGGMGSLYDMIVSRSSDILLDPELRDNPVNLSSFP